MWVTTASKGDNNGEAVAVGDNGGQAISKRVTTSEMLSIEEILIEICVVDLAVE